MKAQDLISAIKNGECNGIFSELYGRDAVDAAIERYTECINEYLSLYGDGDLSVFSVGGRSELMGNHTDHNKGKVIATSISRDIIAVASPVSGNTIRVKSKGHEENSVDLNDLVPSEKRYYTSNELTRGVCAGFVKEGYKVSAFNAYTSSEVLSGSGLSSSAAFEVMLGNILNHLFNAGKVSSIKIAEIAQYAENVFYGKPSGLMDQMACAYGGLITIDFEKDGSPLIEKLESDFLRSKYKLCIIYPGGSHASLNEDYASIPSEMKSVASYFGKEVLRGTDIKKVVDEVAELRNKYGDRAVLRAIHFFEENKRVEESVNALKTSDPEGFLKNIDASGNSSFKYLQNLYSTKNVKAQGLSLALCLSELYLKDKDAHMRVHGGGFAGTVLVIIRAEDVNEYENYIESCFGKDSCVVLGIREKGAIKII